jgi:aspartate racemase
MDQAVGVSPVPDGTVVGVLGGMGPAATADFYDKLVRATPATRDQHHLRVVVWSDPTVPDRSAAIVGDGPDPTPWLLRGGRVLTGAGAGLIAVPCNTAHAFLATVEEQIGVPMVHMIDQTVRVVVEGAPPLAGSGCWPRRGRFAPGCTRTGSPDPVWTSSCRPRTSRKTSWSARFRR